MATSRPGGARCGPATVIDLRESNEWAAGHIPGAEHHPLGTIGESLAARDRAHPAGDPLPGRHPLGHRRLGARADGLQRRDRPDGGLRRLGRRVVTPVRAWQRDAPYRPSSSRTSRSGSGALGELWTSLALLDALRDGTRTVGELVGATGQTQANVSRHLGVLHTAGLVSRRREGRSCTTRWPTRSVCSSRDLVCGRPPARRRSDGAPSADQLEGCQPLLLRSMSTSRDSR